MINTIGPYRELTDSQLKHLDTYLDKSKDTLEEFLDYENKVQIVEFENIGWVEYAIEDNVFWIYSAFSFSKPHKEIMKIWNELKRIAKKSECDRIHFITRRNPKAFERLFNTKTIQYKLEVIL